MNSQSDEIITLSAAVNIPRVEPLHRCSNFIIDINLISKLPYCNRCNLYYKPSIKIENNIVTYYCQRCNNIIGYIDNNAYPIGCAFNFNNEDLIWLHHTDNTIVLSYNDNWHPYIISYIMNLNTSFLYLYVPTNYNLVRANDGFILHEIV